MTAEHKTLLMAIGVVLLIVIPLLVSSKVEEELASVPKAAWVAVEVGGEGVAETGNFRLSADQSFTLHAVLEMEDWRGRTIYYTDARQLRIGGEEVESDRLRRWEDEETLQILWFTVEGVPPFLHVAESAQLEGFRFEEQYRSDWPRGWSIPGSVAPRREGYLEGREDHGLPRFGTQRFHIRIEIFGPESRIRPAHRVRSPGAPELDPLIDGVTAVSATLPDGLELPSAVFGLSQIEVTGELPPAARSRLDGWQENGLVFSRARLINELLESADLDWDDLEWREVDLQDGPAWETGGVVAGALLRAGGRLVVLAADRGLPGQLDYQDLCFDYRKAAEVRPLAEVFEGEGLVEIAAPGAALPPTATE